MDWGGGSTGGARGGGAVTGGEKKRRDRLDLSTKTSCTTCDEGRGSAVLSLFLPRERLSSPSSPSASTPPKRLVCFSPSPPSLSFPFRNSLPYKKYSGVRRTTLISPRRGAGSNCRNVYCRCGEGRISLVLSLTSLSLSLYFSPPPSLPSSPSLSLYPTAISSRPPLRLTFRCSSISMIAAWLPQR